MALLLRISDQARRPMPEMPVGVAVADPAPAPSPAEQTQVVKLP